MLKGSFMQEGEEKKKLHSCHSYCFKMKELNFRFGTRRSRLLQFNNLNKINPNHTTAPLFTNLYGFVTYLYMKNGKENFLSQSEPRVFKHVATLEARLGQELSVEDG